jgi:group I intron endonuclease
MKLIYQEHSLKSGIYKIVSTHTNRIYVGQAKEFKARWNGHKRSLLNGKHQNKFIQADFNKCREELGHDNFLEFHVLEILEGSTKEERSVREKQWIAHWFDNGKQCYNLTLKAVSREGSHNKKPRSEASRAKIADSLKTKHKEDAQFHEQAMMRVREMNLAHRKQYNVTFISPDGVAHGPLSDIVAIRAFCKSQELSCDSMISLARGNAKSCNGWILADNAGYKYQRGNFTGKGGNVKNWSVTLISPTGEQYHNIVNLAVFAREQKLGSGIYGLARGDYASYHGWTRG